MVAGSFVSSSQNSGNANPIENRQLAANMARRPTQSESHPNSGMDTSATHDA